MKAMKILALVFTLMIGLSGNVLADKQDPIYMAGPTGTDVLMEIPVRFISMAQMIAGVGVFVATSPFTALLTAVPPHNAIHKSLDILVNTPAEYTFKRPIGQWDYPSDTIWMK